MRVFWFADDGIQFSPEGLSPETLPFIGKVWPSPQKPTRPWVTKARRGSPSYCWPRAETKPVSIDIISGSL